MLPDSYYKYDKAILETVTRMRKAHPDDYLMRNLDDFSIICLIKGVIKRESDFKADCMVENEIEHSYGLMQINLRWHPTVTKEEMLVPEKCIEYGSNYLREQIDRRNDIKLGISDYNDGNPHKDFNTAYQIRVLYNYRLFLQDKRTYQEYVKNKEAINA